MNKKLNKFLEQLYSMQDEVDQMIGECEEKQDAIQDKAIEHDRDMTDSEQAKYDALDEKMNELREVLENIGYAIEHMEYAVEA